MTRPSPEDSADVKTPAFDTFGLHPDIMKSVVAAGYETATPIQARAIPVILNGRDVMGAAQTGTGKTAAFALPILHRLMPFANTSASPARHPVRALMLMPTRELADQVHENVAQYARYLPLRTAVVYGGVDIRPQKEQLRQGCEILIATPGRLLDHVEQKNVNLGQVGILVLDEADRMLDMGFLPDLDRIVSLLPPGRQGLLFSATFSQEIRKLGRQYLRTPLEIEVDRPNATADTVVQRAYCLNSHDKQRAVEYLVRSQQLSQVIVFSNTKAMCSRLARQLERSGIKAQSIHGNKSQIERMKALDAFKAGSLEVLVATDVAARGLDVVGVPCVINFDLPHNVEDYVHRIGRTGRAGAYGEAISLFTAEEERNLNDIEKFIKSKIPRAELPLSDMRARRSRDKRQTHGSDLHQRAALEPQDEIFRQPYKPTANSSARQTEDQGMPSTRPGSDAGRRSVGVLLGGGSGRGDA